VTGANKAIHFDEKSDLEATALSASAQSWKEKSLQCTLDIHILWSNYVTQKCGFKSFI
jgi:hypothetical protein